MLEFINNLRDPFRVGLGIALAVVGTALVFSRAITPDTLVDYVWMAVGIGLVFGYCVISWDWFENFFGKDGSVALFIPPLMTFGVFAVFISLIETYLVPPHDKVLLGIGAALILIPLALLGIFLREESDRPSRRKGGL